MAIQCINVVVRIRAVVLAIIIAVNIVAGRGIDRTGIRIIGTEVVIGRGVATDNGVVRGRAV